ncbi:MAG TPA: glycosyltransferase, partial [Anaerolineae bacterium]|nr:glycosyltransferase [Anaerolineae bacterium]
KILEAMAHGIPVIAMRAAADGSPIRHEENGLIADNAAEFAAYVVRLWNDRGLCRRFGKAARATIAHEYSQARLRQDLCEILEYDTARETMAGRQ